MVERRREDGPHLGSDWLATLPDELVVPLGVEGECCTTAGVGGRRVREGAKLAAGEVVAVLICISVVVAAMALDPNGGGLWEVS